MASFTSDSAEYKVEYASYTCDIGIDQLTKDVNNLTLPSQDPKDGQKAALWRHMQTSVPSAPNETLPITYQLMVLINKAKFNGSIVKTRFGHHDIAARGSHQIAQGGYFQTREVGDLGVAKYPLLVTASTELSERSYKALANELLVLSHPPLMNHGNIVSINSIGWTRLDPSGAAWMPMIFLELADLGTLTRYLSENQLEVDSKLQIAQDVGSGLQALHACGIMHGDLKLDNVLMFKGNDGKVRAKLSDFGCSYITRDNEDETTTVEISAGTKPWNSPELKKQVPISWLPNVDTYSFGLLVWRVFLNGRDPFEGLEDGDIDKRKAQDLIISDASLSLEDEYNKNMLLRGALSSHDRTHLYMRGVAMPKRCFRHTLSSLIQNRDLNTAVDSFSFEKLYGTVGSTKPTINGPRPSHLSVAVEFLRLFDIPRTAKTMFFQSLQQVAVNDAISRETRANAYLQLCYANINSFGTAKDFAEAIQCLKAAAGLGSAVAASILPPLMLATGHPLDPALENELKRWLVRAVEHGSLLARKELRFLDDDPTTLRNAEEPHRLFMGAKMPTVEGVADADLIEMMFLPANLGTMRVLLGAGRHPVLDRIRGSSTKFMSRSMNTYLHAGAALGVDPDHFRNVISVVDTETINTQDDVGNTALHLAIRFGNVEIAQILLEHKASASLANKRGETPWHWFISLEEEDIDLLAFLMMDDVDGLESFAMARNSEDNQYAVAHGGTPLHWAVDMRLRGMATTLLNYGADPLLEYQGMSPIDLAIQINAVELLEVFLKSVAEDGLDALPLRSLADLINMQHASKRELADKDDEPVDTLLFQTAGLRPLHERLIYGGSGWAADTISTLGILHKYDYLPSWGEENGQARLEAFRLLSFDNATGPDMMEMMINTIGVFPGGPGEAVESTNEAAAAFWKAALNAILKTSLSDMVHFAIDKVREYSSSSRLDDAEALLHGYCASLNADITVVESILKDCSSVDCTDEKERTPLMNAVRDRNFEIATFLLERGADVNRSWVHNGERVYILYEYVVNNTDIDVIPLKYFLEPMHPFLHKTPPLLIGPDSKDTVLHQACKDGNPVIVDYLLSKFGSNDQLNQPGEGGFTALHHAVFNGHADLVMKLCQSGADANARSGTSDMVNRKRSRPLDLCFRWATPSEDFLAYKFGLERAREDIFLGRLRIADFLVRRHRPRSADRPRRADRFLMHRSPALKLAGGAAEEGMTRLLAAVLRVLSKEMDSSAYKDIDYPLLLTNLLWVAASRGHISTTRLLLNLGADIKQRSLKGLSLLHVVSWLGKAEMVYVLVKNGGADINAEDAEGLTVGSYSHWSKNLATVRMVKSLGGYVTIPRASMNRILANTKGIFPMDFNPGFIVKLRGEPSDDDISDKRSDADRSDGDDDNERESDKVADDDSPVTPGETLASDNVTSTDRDNHCTYET